MPKLESKPEQNPYTCLFASWLTDYRERQGISQRRVAALLGVNESTMSRIESLKIC